MHNIVIEALTPEQVQTAKFLGSRGCLTSGCPSTPAYYFRWDEHVEGQTGFIETWLCPTHAAEMATSHPELARAWAAFRQ
jgi:hypothetical protein